MEKMTTTIFLFNFNSGALCRAANFGIVMWKILACNGNTEMRMWSIYNYSNEFDKNILIYNQHVSDVNWFTSKFVSIEHLTLNYNHEAYVIVTDVAFN